MNEPDLFTAAIAARDRRIARLERDLVEARDRIADLEAARAPVIADGDILIFPSIARAGYVHRAVVGAARTMRPGADLEHIERRCAETRDRLARIGMSPEAIEADVSALRCRLLVDLAELTKLKPTGGDAS